MDSIVTARVPSGIKEQGRIALQKIGATPTDLVNAAYRYVLKEGRLPETDDGPFAEPDVPRKLTKEQKKSLKEQIEQTTFAVPAQFWDNQTYEDILEAALKEKYACTD